jgi:hypothetical protein
VLRGFVVLAGGRLAELCFPPPLHYHATPLPVTSVTDNAETVRDWDSDGGRRHDGDRCRRAVVAPRARRCRGLVRWALSSRGPTGEG